MIEIKSSVNIFNNIFIVRSKLDFLMDSLFFVSMFVLIKLFQLNVHSAKDEKNDALSQGRNSPNNLKSYINPSKHAFTFFTH